MEKPWNSGNDCKSKQAEHNDEAALWALIVVKRYEIKVSSEFMLDGNLNRTLRQHDVRSKWFNLQKKARYL